MPLSSGTFTRNYDWTDDAAAGTKISSSRMDTEFDDIAAALSTAIYRDGQTTITANIPWAGYKITDLGDPTNDQDAVTKAYVDNLFSDIGCSNTTGGTADALTLTTDSTIDSNRDGILLGFIAGVSANAAATLNVDSQGAKALRRYNDQALEAGDILQNAPYLVAYDASANGGSGAWLVLNPSGVEAGSVTTAAIADEAVTNAKLAHMAQATIKGRAAGAGTGDATDLTAAQLVDIIETADGAGSGIDADLLDGQQGSYYTNANNISSGTLADGRLSSNVLVSSGIDADAANFYRTVNNGGLIVYGGTSGAGAHVELYGGTAAAASQAFVDATRTTFRAQDGSGAADVRVNGTLQVAGDLTPSADDTYDLGSSSAAFAEVHGTAGLFDRVRSGFSNVNDDAAFSFAPPNANGFLILRATINKAGVFMFSTSAGSAQLVDGFGDVAVASGVLSGTTGADNFVTVSAHTDGNVYVENRHGSTVGLLYLVIA